MTQLHAEALRKPHTVANVGNSESRRRHVARYYVGWSQLRTRL